MALHTARLSKIIMIAYGDKKLFRRKILDDVSDFIRKETSGKSSTSGGGDFHAILWSTFKDCIFEQDAEGFNQAVETLIDENDRRKRLFPLLASGLKRWGLEKRRWMNEDIKRIKNPTGRVEVEGRDIAFSVNNILALEVVGKGNRYVYPYFSEEPALTSEAARVMLWQLHKALPSINIDELRILDVMRGKSFSTADAPIQGDEDQIFAAHVDRIFSLWDERYQERKNDAA